MEEYLPIGTIVELKNKYIAMIRGYFSSSYSNYGAELRLHKESKYDFMEFPFDCCNYKCDYKKLKKCDWYLEGRFTDKDITKVIFEGYKDDSYYELVKKLNE